MELSGWGRYPRGRFSVVRPQSIVEAVPPASGHMIARGQGRSYGNAAMCEDGLVMLTERLNRFLAFDDETGLLRAEAGATIAQVLQEFIPQGWFPSVTPGTKYVSLGGCVAADVHGKNHHHVGTFGAHVMELELVGADRSRRHCSPASDAELFWATVGGMGLTGLITEVVFQLMPIESAYMIVRHRRAYDLDALLGLLEEKAIDDEYTLAWIDCLSGGRSLGRGVLMYGHHATLAELPGNIKEPMQTRSRWQHNLRFDLPSWILNRLTAAQFNNLYFQWQGARKGPYLTDYHSYFYPLDGIGNWNRMYGRRGFVQYQCVLPSAHAREGLKILLEELSCSRQPCFLATLKRLGAEGRGLLSFPMSGYTLTLDIPLGDPHLFPFLEQLDEIVLKHGGRVYLAKDARLGAETFQAMYPRFPEWQRIKAKIDPDNRFSSDLGRRLGMSPHLTAMRRHAIEA